MPYILKSRRQRYNKDIEALVKELEIDGFQPGDINYIFSMIAKAAFKSNPSYSKINQVHGVFHDAAAEFYRRFALPLEDQKIIENGDLE